MIGTTVLQRFHITERLGTGGFGTVYRAWDDRLEREVAVKVIETGPEAGRRVLREAQAAARLNHPGIITLFEFGHHEYGRGGGRAFLVSELVEGDTVKDLIEDGALTDRDIAEIGADLCEALDHAHSRGVVHRDIKPANLIAPHGESGAKLMDFGIARLTDGDELTAAGDVLGTLSYMSPEQAEGEVAGPESDVYSLALTLFEAWAGTNPRRRLTAGATARALVDAVPSLSEYRRDLPPAIIGAVDACLDPEPSRRPSLEFLGGALESELDELVDDHPAPKGFRLGSPIRGAGDLGTIAAAAGTGAMAATVMIAAGSPGPFWVFLLPLLPALVALARPRLGFMAAGAAIGAWLALGAGLPGAALLLVLLTVPVAMLVVGDGRSLILGPVGPLLGTVGAAAFMPILAAMTGRWRDRAVIAASGLAWTATAQTVLGRDLLFGSTGPAPHGWAGSIGATIDGVIVPTVSSGTFFVAIAVWAGVALIAGVLVSAWTARRRTTNSSGPRRIRQAHARLGSGADRYPSLP